MDAEAQLRRAIAVVSGWDKPCDAWFFGGDLSDTGEPETYELLRSIIEPAAEASGVQVIYAVGNHDDPDAFARHLLDEPGASGPLNRTYDVRGLRLIALDSTVAGSPHGEVAEASLEWLAGELAVRAEAGTILALHHPPLPPVQDAAGLWDLRTADAIADLIAGSDVRLIIGGHFHQTSFTTLAGVPVAAAASTVYTQDLTAGRTLRGQAAHPGFNLIEVYADRVAVTAVQLGVGVGVHPALTPDDVAGRLAALDR